MQSIIQLANTAAIVAGAIGFVENTATQVNSESYGAFDSIDLKNFSTERIKVRFDGDSTRSFTVNGGEGLSTDAEDQLFFNFLTIENTDTVNQIEIGELQASFIRTK